MSPYWLLVLPGMWGVALLVQAILFLLKEQRAWRRIEASIALMERHRAEMDEALGRAIR